MAENHKLFNNEKINVYEAQDEVAIDVFDISSSGTKPDGAILVTTGTYVPGAISVNVTNKIPGSLGVKFVDGDSPVPPGPTLPPYTIRLKYAQGQTPTFPKGTGVLIDETNNIWDLTYENSDWNALCYQNYTNADLLEVIGANTTDVTDMTSLFMGCGHLVSVPLFDTSNVTSMNYMFRFCGSLESIPLFDTTKVTKMDITFYACNNVQYGALALYQQISTQSNPPTSHDATFRKCGSNTETGAAELAQIPSDWK